MMIRISAVALAVMLPMGLVAENKPLPAYKQQIKADGRLIAAGSDTMYNLLAYWREGFIKQHPKCTFEIVGKGGSVAIPMMMQDRCDLGAMTRLPKPKEIEAFNSARPDHVLLLFTVAMDAMCIVVHKDCPVEQLSLQQVDAMFSTTLNRGAKKSITQWSQLGVKGDLANQKIQLVGRNSASGTYGFFQKLVLLKGDFRDDVKEQPGSAAVVARLGPAHVGYVGLGYVVPNVKSLKIKDEGDYVVPSPETVSYDSYPLSRKFYIAVAAHKEKGIKPEVQEFLSYVLSREGQDIVLRDGYVPLDLAECRKGHRLLDDKHANIHE